MKIFITLLFFCNFSFAQNEPIINNYGLSNTSIVDNLQLPEQSAPQPTQFIVNSSQIKAKETKEQIDFRNSIESQMSGRLTNSISKAKISQFELEQRRQMASPSIGGLRVDNRLKANTYDTPFNEVYTQLNDGTYKLKNKPSLETHNIVYTQQSDGTYKLKSSNSISVFLIIFIVALAVGLIIIYKLYNKRPLKVALRNRLDKELKVLVDKLPIDGTFEALEKTISNFELTNVFKVQNYATEYNLTTDEVYEVINQYFYDLREQNKQIINTI